MLLAEPRTNCGGPFFVSFALITFHHDDEFR
jgi:hypothetical protein